MESGDLSIVIILVSWFVFSTIKLWIRARYNYNEETRFSVNNPEKE